jgi:violaxanthin de-epoxidase
MMTTKMAPPPFVLIYYRGSNDSWVGYGGAVVYTRVAAHPESLVPCLREAVKKVNFDWDKDFAVTDNSCRAIGKDESILLKEQFAGKMAIQTEQQLLQQAVRVRGNAGNSVKAQQLFISDELSQATKAFEELSAKTREFESEIAKDVTKLENEVVKDVTKLENEVVKDVTKLENEVVKDVKLAEDKVLMKNR